MKMSAYRVLLKYAS